MPTKTDKPPIIGEENFYLLGRQIVNKSEGDGRALTLLLNPKGDWFRLDQISEASGWRHPQNEMDELKYRIQYNTSDRIEKRGREGKKEYRIIRNY